MMNEEDLKGRPDQHKWERIQRNCEFASAQIKVDIPAQRQLEATMQSESVRIAGLATKESLGLVDAMVPAVTTVRDELDLRVDEIVLRQICLDVAARTHEGMLRFMQDMKASVEEHERTKFTDQLKVKPPGPDVTPGAPL
jgi:hypothetical protein